MYFKDNQIQLQGGEEQEPSRQIKRNDLVTTYTSCYWNK